MANKSKLDSSLIFLVLGLAVLRYICMATCSGTCDYFADSEAQRLAVKAYLTEREPQAGSLLLSTRTAETISTQS